MAGPSDTRRLALMGFWACWAICFVYSFVAFATTAPEGEGFLRGMNRVTTFLGIQAIAGGFAIAIWAFARQWPKRSPTRRLGAWPILILGIQIVGMVATILWAGA